MTPSWKILKDLGGSGIFQYNWFQFDSYRMEISIKNSVTDQF